jgi:hypothetical protein
VGPNAWNEGISQSFFIFYSYTFHKWRTVLSYKKKMQTLIILFYFFVIISNWKKNINIGKDRIKLLSLLQESMITGHWMLELSIDFFLYEGLIWISWSDSTYIVLCPCLALCLNSTNCFSPSWFLLICIFIVLLFFQMCSLVRIPLESLLFLMVVLVWEHEPAAWWVLNLQG